MSLSKRLLDLARANLNALLDKAGADTSVDDLTDEELEAELERRRERRKREEQERLSSAAAEEAARVRASARAASQGKSGATQTGARPGVPRGNGARSAGRRPPPPSPMTPERRLRDLYAMLEVPYGSGFDEVKKSFRRLMRKYHPDLHTNDPARQKTATQLTMSLTQAYNELEAHLLGGPNRR